VGGLGSEKKHLCTSFFFLPKKQQRHKATQKKAGFVFVFWYVIKQIERRKLQATKMHVNKE